MRHVTKRFEQAHCTKKKKLSKPETRVLTLVSRICSIERAFLFLYHSMVQYQLMSEHQVLWLFTLKDLCCETSRQHS